MNSLLDRYTEIILDKYEKYNPTIITYGSNCYGENISDLDVCIFVENDFKNLPELISDTIQFSENAGIKVDDEIPHANKLVFTYEQVEEILMDSIFINENGEYRIDDIVKSRDFLCSELMRKRLLINILTTEHRAMCGKVHFVENCEEHAWMMILDSIINTYNLPLTVSNSDILELMYKNPRTGSEGELYLGYKKNTEGKQIYLKNKLNYYLKAFKNKKVNLKSNVNPYFPTPSMLSMANEFIKTMLDYPENKDISLRKKIGSTYGMNENYFMVTNGAMEAIHIVLSSFVDGMVAVMEPTFWGYGDRLRKLGKPFYNIMTDRDNYLETFEEICSKYRYVVICNPNNPTLVEINSNRLEILLRKYPKCMFIIDETIMAFREDYINDTAIKLIKNYNNLIVLMSLSKISGMCGLRCGFIASNPYNLSRLVMQRALYNTNSMCQHYFEKYFTDIINCKIQKEKIKRNFKEFTVNIDKKYVDEIIDTGVVFVLIKFKDNVNLKLLEEQLDKEAIQIQFVTQSYPDIKENWVRISAGRREDLVKLANEINKFMEKI